VHVPVAIDEQALDLNPDDELGFVVLGEQDILLMQRGRAVQPQAPRIFEVDEQHTDFAVFQDVAHRQEHAVTVVARECDRPLVEYLDEPGRSALE